MRNAVVFITGGILVAAALLKVHGLIFSRFEPNLLLSERWQHVILIQVEVLLGIFIVSQKRFALSRLLGIAFFGAGAIASLYLWYIGQASCGCYGEVRVHPWASAVVDLGCLAGLLMVRPKAQDRAGSSLVPQILRLGLVVAAVLALVGELMYLTTRSPESFLARVRGDVLVVEPNVLNVGSGERGSKKLIAFRLSNYSGNKVTVVGGTSACACVATEKLPVAIDPERTQEIPVIVKFTGSPGRFLRQFILYTDHPDARVLYASFTGEVITNSIEKK